MGSQGGSVKKTGRPVKFVFEPHQFESLCQMQCTQAEIAAFFRVCINTLQKHVTEHYGAGFKEVFNQFKDQGKLSIRQQLFKRAIKENKDNVLIHITDRYIGPVPKSIDLVHTLQRPAIIEKLDGTEVVLGSLPIEEITEEKDENNS